MRDTSIKEITSYLLQNQIIIDKELISIKINDNKVNIIIDAKYSDNLTSKIAQITSKLSKNFEHLNFNVIATKAREDLSTKNLSKLKPNKVKSIILVSSCKGGVGKSTVTALLALQLAKTFKIAILDADIYGPSIPTIMNSKENLEAENGKFIPHLRDNIQIVSMGNLLDPNKAAIWRAPMITKALNQLMLNTNWQDTDILLVDTPPGTGDVLLTLAKDYDISGVILVSTPHLLAIEELVKSIDMFNKLSIPIIGAIENMAYYEDEQGNRHNLFGNSDFKNFLEKQNITQLSSIPITKNLGLNISKIAEKYLSEIGHNLPNYI